MMKVVLISVSFGLALFVGIAFWVFVGLLIFSLAKKRPAKKYAVACIVLAAVWIVLFTAGSVSALAEITGRASGGAPLISYESARQNWSSRILKKTSDFSLSVDKVEVVRSEKEWITSTDEQKNDYEAAQLSNELKTEELLGVDRAVTYEITLVLDNRSNNAGISYKELRKANLVYVQDEGGVFIPAYIINHSEFDDVPWILTWFLPQYKKDQKVEYVPLGKSYLNVRADVPKGHTISKFVFADTVLDIGADVLEK